MTNLLVLNFLTNHTLCPDEVSCYETKLTLAQVYVFEQGLEDVYVYITAIELLLFDVAYTDCCGLILKTSLTYLRLDSFKTN